LEALLTASRKGAVTLVHAHGDNMEAVEKYVPLFEGPIIPTVQCAPPAGTHNYGGLTDGDRGVFLADHFGATRIVLAGFDFGDEEAHPLTKERSRKFIWGALLIASLDNPAVMFLSEYDEQRAGSGGAAADLGSRPTHP
jgi:uncharacterized Rossmann fold enzyme